MKQTKSQNHTANRLLPLLQSSVVLDKPLVVCSLLLHLCPQLPVDDIRLIMLSLGLLQLLDLSIRLVQSLLQCILLLSECGYKLWIET